MKLMFGEMSEMLLKGNKIAGDRIKRPVTPFYFLILKMR
jgi:hypothetical protein